MIDLFRRRLSIISFDLISKILSDRTFSLPLRLALIVLDSHESQHVDNIEMAAEAATKIRLLKYFVIWLSTV